MWQGQYSRSCTQRQRKVTSFQKRLDRCSPRSCHALRSRARQIGTSCATCFRHTSQIRTTTRGKERLLSYQCGVYQLYTSARRKGILLWLVHTWVCQSRVRIPLHGPPRCGVCVKMDFRLKTTGEAREAVNSVHRNTLKQKSTRNHAYTHPHV